MGRQIVRRRRRVFSLEPNRLVYVMFARNYVKYLMTALAKIASNPPPRRRRRICRIGHLENMQKLVKFEVDMAMAVSATEFSWGHALKEKLLQRGGVAEEEDGNDNVNGDNGFSLQTVRFSRENLETEEEEEKKMENGLAKLRKVLPGGGDGDGGLEEDDLLKQTESYIKCLELQVNVLRCLVDTNTN